MTRLHPGLLGGAPTIEDVLGAMQSGQSGIARKRARGVLAADPGSWAGWHLSSLISTMSPGLPPLAAFERAAGIAPDRSELWGALAAAFERHRAVGPALRAARRSLALTPEAPAAMVNLAAALKAAEHLAAAGTWLDRAGMLSPGDPVILNDRGLVHLEGNETQDAAAAFHRAVVASPFYADARLNLAIAARRLEQPSSALLAIVNAIVLVPSDSAYLGELGTILSTIGEAESGLAWLGRALAADPTNDAALASRLGAMTYAPSITEAQRRSIYEAFAARVRVAPLDVSSASVSRRDGRVTVGYVSARWDSHPMTQQFAALLAHHRRDRVKTIAYADADHPDDLTRRLKASAEVWHDVAGLSDARVAEMIRADGVDVLVFLALHEDRSRRSLPCYRAAPAQVSLYDIATSGLTAIDAWITDPVLHPSGTTEWFAERLVPVPSLFHFPPPERSPTPPERGGAVRFSSFNNPAKLSRPTLTAWAKILSRVSDASLLLKYRTLYQDPAVTGRIRRIFSELGLGEERIDFGTGALTREEHLQAVASTDIVLDPFPYNGNTATFEALWMGVPVVSLAGSRFIGRMGAGILTRTGLEELVARDIDDYVAIAAALAADAPKRAALRQRLRADMSMSALCDARAHSHTIEDALVALARRTAP